MPNISLKVIWAEEMKAFATDVSMDPPRILRCRCAILRIE